MKMDMDMEPVMNSETLNQEANVDAPAAVANAAARTVTPQSGMTLIEIMIVLAIIALVMGLLVGPAVINQLQKAKVDTAKQMTKQIEGAYAKWQVDAVDKDCPDSLDDLKPAMGRRKTETIKDPWGHEYVLKCGDQAPEECEGFCVLSLGKDGKEGTADDIRSWSTRQK
jgi:general secretion pathway protein G